MDKIKLFGYVYTKDTMGVPCTPGYWISDKVTYEPITMLRISCGGGIGGAQWCEYVKRISFEDLCNNEKIIVETVDGEKIWINTRWVVEAHQYNIAKAVYHSDNKDSYTGDNEFCRLVEEGHTIKLIDTYQHISQDDY